MKTLEIDCRKCKNVGENKCNIYGSDPEKATKACAADGFKNYKKSRVKRVLNTRCRKEKK